MKFQHRLPAALRVQRGRLCVLHYPLEFKLLLDEMHQLVKPLAEHPHNTTQLRMLKVKQLDHLRQFRRLQERYRWPERRLRAAHPRRELPVQRE